MSRLASLAAATRPAFMSRPQWADRRSLRIEVLAAIVVGLALIPEAISFSVIAHVDPRVGLFAAFTMAASIAVVGGRPAMISAANRLGGARRRPTISNVRAQLSHRRGHPGGGRSRSSSVRSASLG